MSAKNRPPTKEVLYSRVGGAAALSEKAASPKSQVNGRYSATKSMVNETTDEDYSMPSKNGCYYVILIVI